MASMLAERLMLLVDNLAGLLVSYYLIISVSIAVDATQAVDELPKAIAPVAT
jgi:hypothetical protein